MNKNRQYEIFTQRLCKTLMKMYPNHEVKHDQKIGGHQIDVTMTLSTPLGNHLTLVECKNYSSTLEMNIARQLGFNMEDLNANGVLVTTCGFDPGVIDIARKNGRMELLQVNFTEKEGGELHFGASFKTSLKYYFDPQTTTARQFEILNKLNSSGALAELEVFRAEDGERIRFGDLHHELPMDGPDGVKYIGFNGIYVRFPSPLNETVRLDSAEYTVVTKGKRWRDIGFTLRATILTANVLNVLTGQMFQIVVDDDF
ncbi:MULTISPECIES: restriction endonuclease [Klebsiella]|uniref:restriction endonuclease n=1 Tax=Klebsiella TaxID=570 RepID=UPI001CB74C78|nr:MULTISPECIES: restriction endonuclease [Klebsiella]HBX1657353.1 hypothetical protein [Klebsiella quasipneumoniae subsp. similipneumoniae]HBX1662890.1 hypothetical protein [Klebsiella quasipneumoniae subsp. similipneumoniae]HBX1719330.1 hypothetical protein [Klebsiella quasipneumoniae subsp. similipneumoniae]HBX1724217.1 hypothetical protein [Klebsiella quasipneumoniae subsp. similipneumoniae]HBX1731231.1 hypothetical protein [Klebsiella quasipneumoniae subsp. similipneumoniae]